MPIEWTKQIVQALVNEGNVAGSQSVQPGEDVTLRAEKMLAKDREIAKSVMEPQDPQSWVKSMPVAFRIVALVYKILKNEGTRKVVNAVSETI